MRRNNLLSIVVTSALLATACGNWTAPLPTAPSDSSKGAVITGTINGLNRSAATSDATRLGAVLLAALDALTLTAPLDANTAITVTVAGTNVTTTVSGSGTFVLEGVPSGNIQLHFVGGGVDARVAIPGVKPEHIQLVVNVNGSRASIESINRIQMDNIADLTGVITAISHGDRSMKVNGFEIKVREAPIYLASQRVDISTLSVGQEVRIAGTWVHDYVVATQVTVNGSVPPTTPPTPPPGPGPTPPPNGGSGETITGTITSISHGDRSMKINGIEIKIWDAPIYQGSQRIGISLLSVGQRVEVTGSRVHDSVVATRVTVL